MSQHDMTVDNGAGVAVRADINLALKALASQSSGPSAPSPTFPCQLWADTGTGRLKRRDSANTLWLDVGILDALGEIQTVASATLTDIGAATSEVVAVSGTTTITGLGSIVAGVRRTVRFTGSLLLTHNATSLILPGGVSITTALNDTAEFLSLGSGNWLCLRYNLASGKMVANPVGTVSQSGGIPTGAIIEFGSNSNGKFTKYADGTLICWYYGSTGYAINSASGTGVFNSALVALTFPFPFSSNSVVPVVIPAAISPAGYYSWAALDPSSANVTTCNLRLVSPSSSATGYFSYIAIGRWF
jgi:hypothetical protein